MTKKIDVFSWMEVQTNEEITLHGRDVRLQGSGDFAVFAEILGHEVCIGFGSWHDCIIAEGASVRIEAPEGVRVFQHVPRETAVSVADSEVFTNADRLVVESGAMLEVKRAVRQLEIARIEMIRLAREGVAEERRAWHAERRALAESRAPAVEEQQPAPEGAPDE